MFFFAILTSSVQKCYSACPPWYEFCTRQCDDTPWLLQSNWVYEILTNYEFRHEAFDYVNSDNQDPALPYGSFRACPPWILLCTRNIVNVPWYLQEKWIEKLDNDKDFVNEALTNLELNENSQIIPQSVCYSACPPWESVCSKQCMNEPWYKSKRYIDEFTEKDEFRRASFSYLRQIHEKEQECYSECPPWFSTCTYQCLPYPWYFSNEWFEIMNKDSTFVSQCFEFLITTLEEHEQQQQNKQQEHANKNQNSFRIPIMQKTKMIKESAILNNIDFPCYSACPPWFKVCTDNCVDKPWFLQETYQKLFNQDSAFRKQAMEYLFSVLNPTETCYSACPPWFQICSQQCMKSPWYLQEQWLQEMTTIDEFRQIVFEFLIESLSPVIEKTQKSPKIMKEDTSNVCYPACPPFVDSCTDECAFEPWFNQKKWNERLFTDSIFRTKSFEHMYNVLNLNTNCNSACPPWFTVCTYQCMNMPWFKQSVWILKMEQDEDFLRKAIDYLVGQLQSEEASHSVNKPSKLLEVDFDKCYSACPPWESVCSKQCMNEPWYKSKRYIDEFKEKDEFRRASFSYLRQIHEKEQECYSECPPWFSTCTYQCLPYPWYFSNEWFEIMNKDSTFVSQCFEFLITTLEEHELQQQQQNRHNKKASKNSDICFEACPPWFKTCPVKCESIIWYMQDQNKIRIRNSKGFRTITIEYFKQRGALNKCFSACPPWFDVCTDQCMSKPWYEQETWTKKMKTDSEFRRQVLEYWTSHQKGQCFSSCPPWYEVCTQECVDRPWYEQEKWIKLMQTDDSFYEKFFTYLDEHGTEQPCFSACPPWFKECNEKCADEPWFLQENWVSKMKSDKEFSQIANEYLPK